MAPCVLFSNNNSNKTVENNNKNFRLLAHIAGIFIGKKITLWVNRVDLFVDERQTVTKPWPCGC